jgi:hypothetical protein
MTAAIGWGAGECMNQRECVAILLECSDVEKAGGLRKREWGLRKLRSNNRRNLAVAGEERLFQEAESVIRKVRVQNLRCRRPSKGSQKKNIKLLAIVLANQTQNCTQTSVPLGKMNCIAESVVKSSSSQSN